MKSFRQFQEASSTSSAATQSAISGSGSYEGGSDIHRVRPDTGFRKRPSTGLGAYAKDKLKSAAERLKNRQGKPKPDGPGKQPDRKPQPYRSYKPQRALPAGKEKPALPAAKERTALPASKDSMVAKKTAASKQPPQHKQISARPASTAMSGSRQRPAIRPAKSNLSRDNMGVQKVSVRDEGPTQKKALPSSQQKALPPAQQRKLSPSQQRQRALPPAR